jgi:hypothetical protein
MAIPSSHRVPLLRGRIISQRDARSGLDVGGSRRVPSPSWNDQSTATGSRCDRKIKPVTLRQNQTAADILKVLTIIRPETLFGAPRIHGELLKLGFEVAQSSVAKFLRNHARDVAAMDLFVVPTIGFDLLYAFIVRLDPRDLGWTSVATHPIAEGVARQITEAFPWNEAPRYTICDRKFSNLIRSRARFVATNRIWKRLSS